jgi:hypothetical protein
MLTGSEDEVSQLFGHDDENVQTGDIVSIERELVACRERASVIAVADARDPLPKYAEYFVAGALPKNR